MLEDKILVSFKGKNVLVTGGTGLIGRQVVSILCDAGACVRIVSLDNFKVDEKAEHLVGDLSNLDYCKEVTKGADFVFHLAGVQGTVATSVSKMASHFVPTLMVNTNVLEAARVNKAQKLVFSSSIGAYADAEFLTEGNAKLDTIPMSFAGWAKRMTELQIYSYKMQYDLHNYSAVRLGAIYGPGDNFDKETAMVIPALISRIYDKENPLVVWGDGSAVRDFMYSTDAAEGLLRALHFGTDGEMVNIASGAGTSIRDVVAALGSFLDFKYEFDSTKPSGAPRRVMDISKARKLLGFEPSVDLQAGLRKTWEWFSAHPEDHKKKQNYFEDGFAGKNGR